MAHGWIYRLVFPNGKSYVGQTINLKKRMKKHETRGCRNGHAITRAILKYGWSNVSIEILLKVEADDVKSILDCAEIENIAKYNTLKPHGYNLTPGGDSQPMENKHVRKWHQKRIKEAMNRDEVREKKRALWKDPAHRSMMREKRTGSDAWMQARKDCQNTESALANRRGTWARKRNAKLSTMSPIEGLKYLQRLRRKAIGNAEKLPPTKSGDRDRVADCIEYWDNEIACFREKMSI